MLHEIIKMAIVRGASKTAEKATGMRIQKIHEIQSEVKGGDLPAKAAIVNGYLLVDSRSIPPASITLCGHM